MAQKEVTDEQQAEIDRLLKLKGDLQTVLSRNVHLTDPVELGEDRIFKFGLGRLVDVQLVPDGDRYTVKLKLTSHVREAIKNVGITLVE